MTPVIWCLSGISLFLGLFVLGIGPATRVGLVDQQTGIGLLLSLAPFVAISCLGALLGVGLATWRQSSLVGLSIMCLVPSLVATAGLMMIKVQADANPFIHDITTDPNNPPQIVAAANEPRANPVTYTLDEPVPNSEHGLTLYAAQQAAFPDIRTITLPTNISVAQTQVAAALEAMELKLIASGPVDGDINSFQFEATDQSTWFGFIDDVVVRIEAISNTESRIDIRSKSRVGISDLGVNGKRVLGLIERLSPPGQGS